MTVIVGRVLLPCRRFVKAGYVGVFLRRGFSQRGGGARVPAMVSPAWLHEQQQYPANKLRILDMTAFSADEGKDAYNEYKKAHVPGAVFYDLFCNVPPSKLFPKPVPDEAAFVKYARSCGVNTSSHVVLYDNTGETYYRPSRGWWLFRLFGHQSVSVLNGGLQQWISEGFQVSNTIMQVEEGDFEANYQPQLIKSFSDVKKNISSKQATHVDCRSYKNHIGDPEDESTGHIPGTIHLHYKPLVNQDTTTLKDVEQLQNIFNEAGIDLQGPVVFSCNRGMAACTELLAAEMCGAVDASVYAGSFTEWKQKAGKELIIQGDELERK